ILLLRRAEQATGRAAGGEQGPRMGWGHLLHESFLNGPVLLLLGSLVIGLATGDRGFEAFKPLCKDLFNGVLVFFLLDLGILAARRVRGFLERGWRLVAFGLLLPPCAAAVALVLAKLAGLSVGDATLLAVLAASASYIAVPAAVRIAIPRAEPAVYIGLALGVTFPFNIVVGIPLYLAAARGLCG
ncbi:MAG: sodium-dependent bicarbonate transport family permease, partial [Actinobacteria bacterium]|nr:sodium-dependent bicarbonate transport family permease [Actinomycetota bacterium]